MLARRELPSETVRRTVSSLLVLVFRSPMLCDEAYENVHGLHIVDSTVAQE